MDTLEMTLSESLVDEIVAAVGLPTTKFNHNIFRLFFQKIINQLAYLGVTFDQIAKDEGLPAASEWALTNFCDSVKVHGLENIPERGPLLVAANHPGAYDGLVLYSQLVGHTIRSVSSEIPFLDLLPNARQFFLFASKKDQRERMLAMRNAVRHLREGGAVIYFGSGHRDPDPTVYPKAIESIDNWLDAFDSFFKYVKELQVLPVIMAGMVSPKWAKHPITWLRKNQIDKQRLAEFGQVITQLRRPGRLMLAPEISIGLPFGENDLRQVVGQGRLYPAVIARVKALFHESRAHFGNFLF